MASNRLRSANKNQGEDAEMDMSPMIDMVFLLLLFFLVVSNPRTIKIDTKVKPPIASHAKTPKVKHGKIVLNIRDDGTFYDESITINFPDEEAMEEYFKKEKEKMDAKGYTARLHVRGDQNAVFKHCRKGIRAAARVGINEVIFGSYTTSN